MPESDFFERRVGTTLRGKWKLGRLLGVGGMAAVYEAEHAQLGRREAVKILHPQIAHAADARQRFEQEARAVAHLRHPGAVAVHDIDVSEEGAPFLVMELLEGESLAEALHHRGPLGPDEVARLADQVLDVLAAAHAVGIIHRDIKPDNLFLCTDGRLRVLDFGVARLRQGDGQPAAPTRTGALIGTVAYMPPEQVIGRSDLDGRADLFSVGATMFRLLTGRHLHPNENEVKQLMEMASVPAPSLRQLAPHLPVAFATVVDRALAFDREHRFASAAIMRQALRESMPGQVFLSAPELPSPSSSASPRPPISSAVTVGAVTPRPHDPTSLPGAGASVASPTSHRGAVLTPLLGAPSPVFPAAPGTVTPWQVTAPMPVAAPPLDGRSSAEPSASGPLFAAPPSGPLFAAPPPSGPLAAAPPSSPSRSSGDAYPRPVVAGGAMVADEPSLVRLGRQTVALPMPLLVGGGVGAVLLVMALVGSLLWTRTRATERPHPVDPIFSPPSSGMTAAPTVTATSTAPVVALPTTPVAAPALPAGPDRGPHGKDKGKKKGKLGQNAELAAVVGSPAGEAAARQKRARVLAAEGQAGGAHGLEGDGREGVVAG